MLPDLVSNPGPLTCKSSALSIVLRGPAVRTVHSYNSWLLFAKEGVSQSLRWSKSATAFI